MNTISSPGGGGVPLTESLIFQKTKLESLDAVRSLNLWGCDINDLSILRRCPNVEAATLSVNSISTLKDLGECKNLKELYLRKNDVTSLAEIQYLSNLKNLRTLWLCDNPCANHPLYRLFAIHCCPGLTQLDNGQVTPGERDQASKLTTQQIAEAGGGGSSSSAATRTPERQAQQPQEQAVVIGGGAARNNVPSNSRPLHQAPSTSSVITSSNAAAISAPQPTTASTGAVTSRSTQKAIVSSILTLLAELTPESLEFLRNDIDDRLVGAYSRMKK